MTNLENVIYAIERCTCHVPDACRDCPYDAGHPYNECIEVLLKDAMELLKEQELHELTKNEWEQWKNNPRRDPICMLWYKDTTPMWILTPVEVHEPAYLMGKIKLFNRKPTTEEIQGAKWND